MDRRKHTAEQVINKLRERPRWPYRQAVPRSSNVFKNVTNNATLTR